MLRITSSDVVTIVFVVCTFFNIHRKRSKRVLCSNFVPLSILKSIESRAVLVDICEVLSSSSMAITQPCCAQPQCDILVTGVFSRFNQLIRSEGLYDKERQEVCCSKYVEYPSAGRYGTKEHQTREREIITGREHHQLEMAQREKTVKVQMQQTQVHK